MNKHGPPQGQDFTGYVGEIRRSQWLASEDILPFGEVRVTIEKTKTYKDVTLNGAKKYPRIHTLKFKGKEREMVLNSVNSHFLAKTFGIKATDWWGKEVILYVDPNCRNPENGRQKINGLRIKAVPAGSETASNDPNSDSLPQTTPDHGEESHEGSQPRST